MGDVTMVEVRRAVRWFLVVAVALTLTGCAGDDLAPVEPLRGGPAGPVEPGEPGSDAEVLENDVALSDLPPEMYDDTPEGFGEVPFEELELPPDEPLPPVEDPGPAPPPAPEQPPATNPPPPTAPPASSPPAGGSVDSYDDYCTLFREAGGVTGQVEEVLVAGPPPRVPEVLGLAESVFRRGAQLGPANLRSAHDRIADAMGSYRSILADYGNSLESALGDPSGAERLAAVETAELGEATERVISHVATTCGVSIF